MFLPFRIIPEIYELYEHNITEEGIKKNDNINPLKVEYEINSVDINKQEEVELEIKGKIIIRWGTENGRGKDFNFEFNGQYYNYSNDHDGTYPIFWDSIKLNMDDIFPIIIGEIISEIIYKNNIDNKISYEDINKIMEKLWKDYHDYWDNSYFWASFDATVNNVDIWEEEKWPLVITIGSGINININNSYSFENTNFSIKYDNKNGIIEIKFKKEKPITIKFNLDNILEQLENIFNNCETTAEVDWNM